MQECEKFCRPLEIDCNMLHINSNMRHTHKNTSKKKKIFTKKKKFGQASEITRRFHSSNLCLQLERRNMPCKCLASSGLKRRQGDMGHSTSLFQLLDPHEPRTLHCGARQSCHVCTCTQLCAWHDGHGGHTIFALYFKEPLSKRNAIADVELQPETKHSDLPCIAFS